MIPELSATDRAILERLRAGGQGVSELAAALGVTNSAVRQRLDRLEAAGLVAHNVRHAGRGRPSNRYTLTDNGLPALGHNLADLARVLWEEVRRIPDTGLRRELLRRVSMRLASLYGPADWRPTYTNRLAAVAGALRARSMQAQVAASSGGALPVLQLTRCPYPDLSRDDDEICELETAMLSEMVGQPMHLRECRCHSPEGICTFEVMEPGRT
jgi:predicted ArsR family transcriptional regulator